MVILT